MSKRKRAEATLAEEVVNWEEEKKRIASTHVFEPKITLDVGDHLFTTTTATLTHYPDTMLGAMFSGRHALIQDKNGTYFIDRDGTHFREILNFLRGSTASTLKLLRQRLSPGALEELKVEADFYGLKELMFPFTPAEPVFIESKILNDDDVLINNDHLNPKIVGTITQDYDQLWYIQNPSCGVAPRLVTVCDHCKGGYILEKPDDDNRWDDYPGFAIDRIINDAQPRPSGRNFLRPNGKCMMCT